VTHDQQDQADDGPRHAHARIGLRTVRRKGRSGAVPVVLGHVAEVVTAIADKAPNLDTHVTVRMLAHHWTDRQPGETRSEAPR
jgi:hypothetical protein